MVSIINITEPARSTSVGLVSSILYHLEILNEDFTFREDVYGRWNELLTRLVSSRCLSLVLYDNFVLDVIGVYIPCKKLHTR